MQGLLDAGADRVSIADTVGYAAPGAVRELFEQARKIAGEQFWCGHFHDTRGLALANVYAAMETGVARFDATLAGIGGCPHAPGASGNASSEDLAFMLESMGIGTGIDIEKLLALRAKVAEWLSGETLHGTLVARRTAQDLPFFPIHDGHRGLNTMSTNQLTGLPLEGIRVIEFTHMVMGPTCGMILADLGAEVIKIEPPGGDKTRTLPGLGIGFFRSFNRNKKSVVLDINTPEGRATAEELVGTCDVVLENFRPGLMSKLGLDYETLSKKHPRTHLRLAQGLPARPVRKAPGARRGGADDGRPLLHDGPQGPPAARRHLGQRHHGRHVRRDRRAGRAARARAHGRGPGSAERAVRELRVPVFRSTCSST